MKDKRTILITGCFGFIGTNAVEAFIEDGWEVHGVDDLSRKGTRINAAYLENKFSGSGSFYYYPVSIQELLTKFTIRNIDVVLHLAAQTAVTTSIKDPKSDFQSNLEATFMLLENIRKNGEHPLFINASTNKVYGELVGQNTPVNEKQPLDFHTPYGCSKGAAEQYVLDYARTYGIPSVSFRQSCIYGPHQMGVEDQGWVAWFIIAKKLGKQITVYGDGEQVRDLLYVGDLIDAYKAVIDDDPEYRGMVYNVGGGKDNQTSINDFLSKYNAEFKIQSLRMGDQKYYVSDNSLLTSETSWKPTKSMDEGIPILEGWIDDNIDDLKQLFD